MECSRCNKTTPVNYIDHANSSQVEDFIEASYYTTFCKDCLSDVKEKVSQAALIPLPDRHGNLVEGIHYYMENGFMVFTELYHIAKGYCCRSGCRHCAYGYEVDL